jgi:hypothetical protein
MEKSVSDSSGERTTTAETSQTPRAFLDSIVTRLPEPAVVVDTEFHLVERAGSRVDGHSNHRSTIVVVLDGVGDRDLELVLLSHPRELERELLEVAAVLEVELAAGIGLQLRGDAEVDDAGLVVLDDRDTARLPCREPVDPVARPEEPDQQIAGVHGSLSRMVGLMSAGRTGGYVLPRRPSRS